jgi:hypothetical protein
MAQARNGKEFGDALNHRQNDGLPSGHESDSERFAFDLQLAAFDA